MFPGGTIAQIHRHRNSNRRRSRSTRIRVRGRRSSAVEQIRPELITEPQPARVPGLEHVRVGSEQRQRRSAAALGLGRKDGAAGNTGPIEAVVVEVVLDDVIAVGFVAFVCVVNVVRCCRFFTGGMMVGSGCSVAAPGVAQFVDGVDE